MHKEYLSSSNVNIYTLRMLYENLKNAQMNSSTRTIYPWRRNVQIASTEMSDFQ